MIASFIKLALFTIPRGIWSILSWLFLVIVWLFSLIKEKRQKKATEHTPENEEPKKPSAESKKDSQGKRKFPQLKRKMDVAIVIFLILLPTVCLSNLNRSLSSNIREQVVPVGKTQRSERQITQQAPAVANNFPQPLIFTLVVGERTPTVTAGPGKNFVVISNKPYKVVSVQKDGTEKIYDVSAGRTIWKGREPETVVWLIGVEENTIIKISPE